MRRGSRLDVRNLSCGAPRSIRATSSAQASTTCSQLSRTISSLRSTTNASSASTTVLPAFSTTPRTDAVACATRSESRSGASSTNHTPSSNSSRTSAATCSDSRVLPSPPLPNSVTSRERCNSAFTSAISRDRPTNAVICCGRLFGIASSDRSAGNSPRNCGWTIWWTCSGLARSRRRRRPRSRSSTPWRRRRDTSSATLWDTSACPP